jgi:hypothetical protein
VLEGPKNLPRDLIYIMIDQKQPKNVEYFNHVGSMITNDARCTRGIKSKIPLAKAALNKKKSLFTNKLELLYSFFWVIPRRLNFMCRHFGKLCFIFIGGVSRKKSREIGITFKEETSKVLHLEYNFVWC